MSKNHFANLLDNLEQDHLRSLEPLAQQIFCQRVAQYGGCDTAVTARR